MALWAYRTSAKTTIGFTPFQLVYGLEVVLPIKCEILSLKLAIELLPATSKEEKLFLYLAQLNESRRTISLVFEAHKKCIKGQHDQSVNPHIYSEGDLVLLYGIGKFEPIWHGPYVVKRVLIRGAYELIDYNNISLDKLRNCIYIKRYYE